MRKKNYSDPTKPLDQRKCLCGRYAILKDYGMRCVIRCHGCGSEGPLMETQSSAIVEWNKRNIPEEAVHDRQTD